VEVSGELWEVHKVAWMVVQTAMNRACLVLSSRAMDTSSQLRAWPLPTQESHRQTQAPDSPLSGCLGQLASHATGRMLRHPMVAAGPIGSLDRQGPGTLGCANHQGTWWRMACTSAATRAGPTLDRLRGAAVCGSRRRCDLPYQYWIPTTCPPACQDQHGMVDLEGAEVEKVAAALAAGGSEAVANLWGVTAWAASAVYSAVMRVVTMVVVVKAQELPEWHEAGRSSQLCCRAWR
jgi:hypothetical protein